MPRHPNMAMQQQRRIRMRACVPVRLCQTLGTLRQESSERDLLQAQHGDRMSRKLEWLAEGELLRNHSGCYVFGLPGDVGRTQVGAADAPGLGGSEPGLAGQMQHYGDVRFRRVVNQA